MPFDGQGDERFDALIKIDKVIDLLSTKNRWCQHELRSHDNRRCILGAMMAADAIITLREPILFAIKQVTGRDYLEIEKFNDHPLTTYAKVREVLERTRHNILADLKLEPSYTYQPAAYPF